MGAKKSKFDITKYDLTISDSIKTRTKHINKMLPNIWVNTYMNYINKHPEYPWNWLYITLNVISIDESYIKLHPTLPWDSDAYLMKKHIRYYMRDLDLQNIIFENQSNDWDYAIKDIEDKNRYKINFDSLSSNLYLTFEILDKMSYHSWNWNKVSKNDFNSEREKCKFALYKQHLSAIKIQKAYKKARYDPKYKLCRDKLNKFYDANFTTN